MRDWKRVNAVAESGPDQWREWRRRRLALFAKIRSEWPIVAYAPNPKQDVFHRSKAGTRVLSGGNQCTVISSPVMTYNGEVPAGDVEIGDRLIGGTVIAKYLSPEKVNVFRLKLSSGLELDANAEHPVMTRRGWVRFDALTMEDEVQVSLESAPTPETIPGFSYDDGRALGAMVGNGCMRHQAGAFGITSADSELLAFMEGYFGKPHVVQKPGAKEYRWCSVKTKRALIEAGLLAVKSPEKTIPQICTSSRESARGFLRGYTETDGCVYADPKRTKDRAIIWISTSEVLIKQVQRLLLTFGIYSTLKREEFVGFGVPCVKWRLRARGPHADRFVRDIGATQAKLRGYQPLTNGDVQPNPFNKIASLKHIGKDYVVGFTVDPTNTYVAAGIVSHNSGKTHAGIAEDIAVAAGFRPWLSPDDPDYLVLRIDGRPMPVPNTQRLICTDFPNGLMSAIWPKFLDLVPRNGVQINRNAQGFPTHWVFPWGSEIFVMSMEQDDMKFQSGTFHSVHYDEPVRRQVRLGCLRGLMRTAGLEFFTMTPLAQDYLLDEVFAKEDGRTIDVINIHTEDNLVENGGVLSRPAYERYLSTMTEEEKEIRLHGNTAHLIGKCLPRFQERHPWVPADLDDDWYPPKNWFRVMVIDTHERKPDCVCWFAGAPDGNRWILYDAVMDLRTQGSVRRTAATIHTFEREHGAPANRRLGDPRALAKNLREVQKTVGEELADFGVLCDPGPGLRVGAGIKRLNQWFEINPVTGLPFLQVHRRCTKAIREFRYLSWERKKMLYTKRPATIGPDDHVSCGRYFVLWHPSVEQETLASRVPKPHRSLLEVDADDDYATTDVGDGTYTGY